MAMISVTFSMSASIPADAAAPVHPENLAVRRPRLHRRLADIVHSGVVVIRAGAGYGKTALLRDWIADVGTEFDVVSIELTSPNEDEFAQDVRIVRPVETDEALVNPGIGSFHGIT